MRPVHVRRPASRAREHRPAERARDAGARGVRGLVGRGVGNHLVARAVLARELHGVREENATHHVRWFDGQVNIEPVPDGARPVVIEVMERDVGSAVAKIKQIADLNKRGDPTQPRIGIAIAMNARASDKHFDAKTGALRSVDLGAYGPLAKDCHLVAQALAEHKVLGACFPAVWSPTEPGGKGYTFPFLEMRAGVTLHAATRALVKYLVDSAYYEPVVRSMDADVTDDPLLAGNLGGNDALDTVYAGHVLSGGYSWDATPKDGTFWGTKEAGKVTRWNGRLVAALNAINQAEHQWRAWLAEKSAALVYWPEPNTYMSHTQRLRGAQGIAQQTSGKKTAATAQQRETIFYLQSAAQARELTGRYDPALTVTKPLKDYFVDLVAMIKASDDKLPSDDTIRRLLEDVRQSHLRKGHFEDIFKWYGIGPLDRETMEEVETRRAAAVDVLLAGVRTALQG